MSSPTIPERMLMALADASDAVDSFSLAGLMNTRRSMTIAAILQRFAREGYVEKTEQNKYVATPEGREEGQRLKQQY